MAKLACIFPGQGSQSVGMGLDLYEKNEVARSTFDAIDVAAGRSLSKLCFKGPEEELKRTIITQPTILAVSLAAWRCYESAGGPRPDYVAGHSLGEFTALVASGTLSIEPAVKLVLERAKLMEACPAGAMSAVIGLAPVVLEEVCAQAREAMVRQGRSETESVVIVANYNTHEQLVISGSPYAVAKAGELAKGKGGKVIPLPVGGAFHSPLMASAAEDFARELERFTLKHAQVPVVQNYDARPATLSGDIKSKLRSQMPNSVRWCETIEYMLSAGVDTFVEIGPGKALAGMVKKINRDARVYNISDTETLAATLHALRQTSPVG